MCISAHYNGPVHNNVSYMKYLPICTNSAELAKNDPKVKQEPKWFVVIGFLFFLFD